MTEFEYNQHRNKVRYNSKREQILAQKHTYDTEHREQKRLASVLYNSTHNNYNSVYQLQYREAQKRLYEFTDATNLTIISNKLHFTIRDRQFIRKIVDGCIKYNCTKYKLKKEPHHDRIPNVRTNNAKQ